MNTNLKVGRFRLLERRVETKAKVAEFSIIQGEPKILRNAASLGAVLSNVAVELGSRGCTAFDDKNNFQPSSAGVEKRYEKKTMFLSDDIVKILDWTVTTRRQEYICTVC